MIDGEIPQTGISDARWSQLRDRPWVCVSCGNTHVGIFDLACAKPDFWEGAEEYAPNVLALESTHFLSEDFCVLNDQHYFVRCVLGLPLIGLEGERFGFGVWATLSKPNFARYIESFDSGEQGHLGPWFGWFSNRLIGYPDTLNLKCQVHPRSGRQRPWIELEPTDHPLAVEQRVGVTYDRLVDLYAIYGHQVQKS
jgi:hypothetical protein